MNCGRMNRKDNIKRGLVTQSLFSFRIDNELLTVLRQLEVNKGRFINDAIRDALVKKGVV